MSNRISPRWFQLVLMICLSLCWFALRATLVYAEPHTDPPASVSFPGNYANQLGGKDWEPADPTVQASDADGDGLWTLTVALPAGSYEFKAALNGSWDENYGADNQQNGANIPLLIPTGGSDVTFSYNHADHAITFALATAGQDQAPAPVLGDNTIVQSALLHDSHSDRYRLPFGAVPTSKDVTLRLRTAADDVQQVDLLLFDRTANTEVSRAMKQIATNEGYEYWEVTLNSGYQLTAYSYLFAITDGSQTLYYADNGALDGGEGQVYASQPQAGQGWDIYVYQAGFTTPEWAQNAIIYQIFPDRFRNGDPSNDPTDKDWFYPGERGHAFPVTPWNRPVPDPVPTDEQSNPEWGGTFSSSFYGGDLQGVMEQLEYLQSLGVTAIYFNPIFESPSNHKYDGRDYRQVDDNLAVLGDPKASNAFFTEFAAEVQKRGMHLILDGVPNHLSSDSPFFDLYKRDKSVGACEDAASPYRAWFFFDPARPQGSGTCAGDTNYRAWGGYGSLPQLNTANPDVIANWLGGSGEGRQPGIVQQWLTTPGVDGFRIDVVPDVVGVNPQFFEQFRQAAKQTNFNGLLISETWDEKDARMRLLGDEFDSTMNYRFRRALLGFLRDTDFEDNDGRIAALTPSQFDDALRAIQEDYPPAALAVAMNLIDSHDVNRAVQVLDHDGIDYNQTPPAPVNDFVDGRNRLAMAAVLQFTLPGAPTVYYGDEVGLTGFGSEAQRDDPYNRQPYPWPDAEGYDQLPAWRQQDAALLAHYQRLGQLRNTNSYLRTGTRDTLLVEDESKLYVYGRRDTTGAALIAFNRDTQPHTVTLDLKGYIPLGASLLDPFTSESSAITQTLIPTDSGVISYAIAGMSYQIWHTEPGLTMTLPSAPLYMPSEGNGMVAMMIFGDDNTDHFDVYRSYLNGSYQLIDSIPGAGQTAYTDTNLVNGETYYYQVRSVAANGLQSVVGESDYSSAIPHIEIEQVQALDPLAMLHTISAITPSVPLIGSVFAAGLTDSDGPGPDLWVQIGYTPKTIENDVTSYVWVDASYVSESQGGADIYQASFLPDTLGDYTFKWRASTTRGRNWTESENTGVLTVIPGEDREAPNPPTSIQLLSRSSVQLAFAWQAEPPSDFYNFRICRKDISPNSTDSDCAERFDLNAETTAFTDTNVLADHVYSYTVYAVDTSFNLSLPDASLVLTASVNMVDVTWRVKAPAETPMGDLLFIAGDDSTVFGAAWNPGLQPITPTVDGLWEWTATVKEGSPLQYKYTRGSWEQVEQWGMITGTENRHVTIVDQGDNKMLIDDTATNWGTTGTDDHRAIQAWRDPVVASVGPAPAAITATKTITVTFTLDVKAAELANVITLKDSSGKAVAGDVKANGPRSFTYTPKQALKAGKYEAAATGVETDVKMSAPYTWTFTVK